MKSALYYDFTCGGVYMFEAVGPNMGSSEPSADNDDNVPCIHDLQC